jgi:2-polyprenyl-3-methyl-5-hydroxy-6-metoxy-1,4-benzoquinol methylase
MNSASKKRCFICGSRLTIELKAVFDTRFGIEDEYDIGRCEVCGLIQTVPSPSSEELKQLYEKYYNFGGSKKSLYTKLRKTFLESVFYRLWMAIDGDICFHSRRGKGRLLDIGCNEGRGLRIYKANGFDAEGFELNEVAAKEARAKGFTVYTEAVENSQPEQPYDVIVLSNVLEHSLDPKNMLFHVHRILKPGGQVWISLPNVNSWLRHIFGKYWINWHVPFHLFHFSSKTLGQLLQRSGFETTDFKYVTPSHWVSQSILAAIFAKPGRQTRQLRSSLLVASFMMFCRFLLFPFLWLGNLTGHGDCLVVEAVARDDRSKQG